MLLLYIGVLTIGRFLEVDVGVAERSPGHDVAAHADGQHAAGLVELLEEKRLVDVRVKIADVEGGYGVVGAPGRNKDGHLGVGFCSR